jgi:predicted phage-related endonuclease
MGNDEAALVRLWREKRGEAEPEDLSGNLIVQLGIVTEELNRSWYERNTGRIVGDVQRRVQHSAIPWMVATLDGIVEESAAVFEAKFMLPWSFSEEAAAEKYMAQVQHNMWVTPRPRLRLLGCPFRQRLIHGRNDALIRQHRISVLHPVFAKIAHFLSNQPLAEVELRSPHLNHAASLASSL